MKDCLIFSFHRQGCTIFLCKNDIRWTIAELSDYDMMRQLPIEATKLFAFMEHGTEAYFYLSIFVESGPIDVPQAFYDAFGEGGTL